MGPSVHLHPVFLVIRVCLGVFFIYVGGEKLFRLDDFAQDVANYQLVFPPVDGLVAYFVPWLELFAGLGLVFGRCYRGALLIVVLSLIGFIGGIASAWFRGLEINCGCFGASDEVTNYPAHIALNTALVVVALLLAWEYGRMVMRPPRDPAVRGA